MENNDVVKYTVVMLVSVTGIIIVLYFPGTILCTLISGLLGLIIYCVFKLIAPYIPKKILNYFSRIGF